MRRRIFEEDDGLASVAGMEAGNSGRFCSSSLPAASSLVCRSPGPASAGPGRADRHFLDACFLCNKPLANETIFMYRGDTPFCSQECRLEQMNKDDAEEFKDWSLTPKVSGSREEAQKPPGKPRNYHAGAGAGAGAVAAAG